MTGKNSVDDSIDEQLIVTCIDAEDGVYRVENRSHENPVEHTYKVFVGDNGSAYFCECPDRQYRHNECKHMRAVESKLEERQEWRDWQVVQKEREEEEREQALFEAKTRMFENGSLERADVAAGIVDAIVAASMEQDQDEEAVEETEQDDDDEESIGSQMAKELLEGDHDLPTEDEWRKMSSDARAKTVAFLN